MREGVGDIEGLTCGPYIVDGRRGRSGVGGKGRIEEVQWVLRRWDYCDPAGFYSHAHQPLPDRPGCGKLL